MRQSIQQRGGHFLVNEHTRPFAEAEVGRDGDAGALVELADEVEQQRTAGLADRQKAGFVQGYQVDAGEPVGQATLLVSPAPVH